MENLVIFWPGQILRIILLAIFLSIGSAAIAQPSGGLPPIRRSEPTRLSPEAAEALINQGWREFLGASGIVNERKARDLTLLGVDAINEESIKSLKPSEIADMRYARSVGLNNLKVFDHCAIDAQVRNQQQSQSIHSRQEYLDHFSIENFLWNVFLKRQSVRDVTEFIQFLQTLSNPHPINRYVAKLGSRLPDSVNEAYRVLEEFAIDGDPEAAKWMAYRYECREAPPQIHQAMTWYRVAISNFEKAGGTQPKAAETKKRLQRLNLIHEGKLRRN